MTPPPFPDVNRINSSRPLSPFALAKKSCGYDIVSPAILWHCCILRGFCKPVFITLKSVMFQFIQCSFYDKGEDFEKLYLQNIPAPDFSGCSSCFPRIAAESPGSSSMVFSSKLVNSID
jgi:hypothetical protein